VSIPAVTPSISFSFSVKYVSLNPDYAVGGYCIIWVEVGVRGEKKINCLFGNLTVEGFE
jgi:hypothetical protein